MWKRRFKIIRIRARKYRRLSACVRVQGTFRLEMYPVHGHKRLDDDAFLASLSHSRKAMVLRADASRYSLET